MKPIKTKLTAIVMTDSREWDDPLVMFVETENPSNFLADVRTAFFEQLCGDPTETAIDFWKEEGAVVKAVIAGHVQIYSAPVGTSQDVDDYSIKCACDESAQGVFDGT